MTDKDILALTIYGEARGEYDHPEGGLGSLMAIANVVMNRMKRGGWFGTTVKEVCLKPYQFSCWNSNNPNKKILDLSFLKTNEHFKVCCTVAEGILSQGWPDLTKGSDHYHAVGCSPKWQNKNAQTIKIANHIFYRLTKGV